MKLFIKLLFFFFALCIFSCTKPKQAPKAENGVIDLTEWDFEKDGNIKLDGEWEFYWKEIYSHENFRQNRTKAENSPAAGDHAWLSATTGKTS